MLSALTRKPGRLAPIYLPAVPRTHAHCEAAHSFHLALTHLPSLPPSPRSPPTPLGRSPRLGCLTSLSQVGLCSNSSFINGTNELILTCFPLAVTNEACLFVCFLLFSCVCTYLCLYVYSIVTYLVCVSLSRVISLSLSRLNLSVYLSVLPRRYINWSLGSLEEITQTEFK